MNKEEILQSKIVVRHSQEHPEQYGQLFHPSNERNHKLQAFKAKTIGIVSGVADLLYVSKKRNVATELKIDGSRHELATVKAQVAWGKVWEKVSKKNVWRMCFTVDQAINCYEGKYEGYTLEQVSEIIKDIKTKTFKIVWKGKS